MKLTFYVCKEVDYSKAPDVVAVSCRGVHRYMVSWELHGRHFKPTCRCGWPLKVNRWTSAQAEGKARPMLKGGGRRAFTASWVLECPVYVVEGAAPGRATRGFCQASDMDPRRLTFIATDPLLLESS